MFRMNKLVLFLLVIAGYMISRSYVYQRVPVQTTSDWLLRDTIMDLPRIAAALFTLYFGCRAWGWKKLGFDLKGAGPAAVVGAALLLTEIVFSWLGSESFVLPGRSLYIFLFSSFVVGSVEEVLFRGALLNALRDWKGDLAALWASSFLFTIYHVQAQPYAGWPGIFMIGFVMALLRLNGVSILWLILIHGMVDCVCGLVGRNMDTSMILFYDSTLLLIVLALAVHMRLNSAKAGTGAYR
jgi:membrane protease YdiL (CAAX protease family)